MHCTTLERDLAKRLDKLLYYCDTREATAAEREETGQLGLF